MMSRREDVKRLRADARGEAARLLRIVSGPRGYEDTIQACIARAATTLGWRYSRARHIWHETAALIESFEMDQLRRVDNRASALAAKTSAPADSSKKTTARKSR